MATPYTFLPVMDDPTKSWDFPTAMKAANGQVLRYRQLIIRCGGLDASNGNVVFDDCGETIVMQSWDPAHMISDPNALWEGVAGTRPDRYDAFRFKDAHGRIDGLACPEVVYDFFKGAPQDMEFQSGYWRHSVHPQPGLTAGGGAVHRDGIQIADGGARVTWNRFTSEDCDESRVSQAFYINGDSEDLVITNSHIRSRGSSTVFLTGGCRRCGARCCDLYADLNPFRTGNTNVPIDVVDSGNRKFKRASDGISWQPV